MTPSQSSQKQMSILEPNAPLFDKCGSEVAPMALIAHQTKGPVLSHPLSSKASTQRENCGPSTVMVICETYEFVRLKHHFCFRQRPIFLRERKSFNFSSFKSNAQNDGPERRNSKIFRPPVQVSGMQQGREDVLSESHDVQKHPLSYTSEDKKSTTMRSLAIQKLFGKWLVMLRTQTSNHTMDENLTENAAQCASKSQEEITGTKLISILKVALVYFLGLDAAISIPLVIFIPWFLTVNLVHGTEVTKELMPLWIVGPLVVALYMKIVQVLCSLCLFLFMLAMNSIKNPPRYSLLVYNYTIEGNLGAYLWTRLMKPFMDIKNLDYWIYVTTKYKQLEAWTIDKYLDFFESIWPYYCRTIRFLKKANLI
ncbi:hypothetical protein Cni_G11621 [Canna indica]|uniref:Uncharacterized protein n=1 Tax=Canna indica TaxID=4628 RepID=A0AAQ3K6E7_9LILI|nr:hypothetical protein Cni_G11621 [Canna indica]